MLSVATGWAVARRTSHFLFSLFGQKHTTTPLANTDELAFQNPQPVSKIKSTRQARARRMLRNIVDNDIILRGDWFVNDE